MVVSFTSFYKTTGNKFREVTYRRIETLKGKDRNQSFKADPGSFGMFNAWEKIRRNTEEQETNSQ